MNNIRNFKVLEIIVKMLLISLLTFAIFDLSYSYYEVIRFVVMVLFILLGYFYYENQNKLMMIIWFSFALLVNPYYKLMISREVWQIIDLLLITLLAISFATSKTVSLWKKVHTRRKIGHIIALIIWTCTGWYATLFHRPRTIEYYTSKGMTDSYARELFNSRYENEQIISAVIAVITVTGFILIIINLNKGKEIKT